jgi:hypothetical protein
MTSSTARPAAHCTGPPAKVEPWIAGGEDLGQALAGDQRTDRQPAAEGLGDGQGVGDDA